jgi:uncharacterized membrane protein SpoIIM required for sporulation
MSARSLRLAFRFWVLWFITGTVIGTLTGELAPQYQKVAVDGVSSLPGLAAPIASGSPFLLIFMKNSLASLTTIFLGPIISLLELKIFTTTSEKTYGFLESLTAPFYRIAETLHPPFKGLKPFFRSCYFYLYFVPLLAMGANGVVLGFLLTFYHLDHFLGSLLPHGVLEFPAFFASVVIGLSIARQLKPSISRGNVEGLKTGLYGVFGKETLGKVVFIQLVLLQAAYLETLTP